VVRVVSSAFGSGADWEGEFFEEMEKMWRPFFDRLRLYVAHFPGQQVTKLEVGTDLSTGPESAMAAMRRALGVAEPGQPFRVRDLTGQVEGVGDVQLLVRLTDPVPGLLAFVAFGTGPDTARAEIHGQFFSPDAPAFAERERPAWQAWLESLGIGAPSTVRIS
jgi:hypothetical protein